MRIKNWGVFSFVAGYHVLLLALLPWFIQNFSWTAMIFFFVTYIIGGISITAGYHRLFSHKTYSANPFYEWAVLLGATLSMQWSALNWSHDHRLHHNFVDTDDDPYSIKKGFWYAHMLWLFVDKRTFDESVVPDLMKNPRVMIQHNHFLLLTVVINVAIFALGCLFMHPLASFFSTFLLRVFAIHHSTWFINSLAHTWGSKTYARELSAVDNIVLAFLTFGEGYHNYHHAFANDYRNGIRWWHFDPTKWLVWTASKFGLVHGLRRVNQIRLQRVLVNKDRKMLVEHLNEFRDEAAQEMRMKIEELAKAFETQSTILSRKLSEMKKATTEKRRLLKIDIRRHQQELRATWDAWVRISQLAATRYRLEHDHAH